MTRRARPVAVALAAVAIATVPAAVAQSVFSRADYVDLVRRYARGERAQAIAGLGAWSERDLARQLAGLEQEARAAERCPTCPNRLDADPARSGRDALLGPRPRRAAVARGRRAAAAVPRAARRAWGDAWPG